MKKSALVMIIVWSLIGLLIIAAMAAGIALNSTRFAFGPTQSGSFTGEQELILDETVDLAGVTRMNMDFSSDTVRVLPSENGQLRVVQYGKNLPESRYYRVTRSANTITVSQPVTFGFQLGGIINSQSIVEVYIPAAYDQRLDMELSSGQMDVSVPLSPSELNVDLSSGNMEFIEDVTAGRAFIEMSSGSMKISALSSGSFNLDASSGKLTVGELSGKGSIGLSSGRITVNRLELGESLETDVSSGKLEVGIAGNPAIHFTGERFSGTLDTYFGLQYDGDSRSEMTATVGEAPYRRINASVSSGSTKFTQVL